MAKAWMPFYIADYLADTGHLTTEQHGAFVLSLFHYWQTNQPLTTNAEQLQMICRCMDAAKFLQIWNIVSQFYTLDGDVWRNLRMDKELLKAQKLSETRASAAKTRYNKPPAKAPAIAVQKQTQSQSQSQRTKYTEDDLSLADKLQEELSSNWPEYPAVKNANIKQWATEIRKLRELDGFTLDKILEVCRFAMKDTFWSEQFKSVQGLRNKSGNNGLSKFENMMGSIRKTSPLGDETSTERRARQQQ